jgi:hypothetical protein
MVYHYENNEFTDICAMLSEYSRGIHQTVRKAISGKTPSWATSVINLVQREIDRTGLKILENNKNIQSIISVNTNILLRRFRLKFLKIMYSTSCYTGTHQLRKHLYKAISRRIHHFCKILQL